MRKTTAFAVSVATVAGIAIGITGTLALTYEPAPRTVHTAPIERPDTFCQDMAERILSAYSVTLTAWENGTAYDDSIRTDNVDVYAEQLSANCQD